MDDVLERQVNKKQNQEGAKEFHTAGNEDAAEPCTTKKGSIEHSPPRHTLKRAERPIDVSKFDLI